MKKVIWLLWIILLVRRMGLMLSFGKLYLFVSWYLYMMLVNFIKIYRSDMV